MDDKKILKRKAPKMARLAAVRDYLLDLAEQNDIDFVDLDTKYSYQELANKIKKDIDIDVTADQLDDLFTEAHFDCGDLGDDVALEFDESLTVTIKKLNERLTGILSKLQFCESNDVEEVAKILGSMLFDIQPTKNGLKYINNRDVLSYYGIGMTDRKSIGIEINVDDDYIGNNEVSNAHRIPKIYVRYDYDKNTTLRYPIDIDPERYGFHEVKANKGVRRYEIKLDAKDPITQIQGLSTFFKDFLQAADKCLIESSNEDLSYLHKYSSSDVGSLILKMGQELYCTDHYSKAFFNTYKRYRNLGMDVDWAFVPTFKSKVSYIPSAGFDTDGTRRLFLFKNDKDVQTAADIYYDRMVEQRKSVRMPKVERLKVYADEATLEKWLGNCEWLYFVQFNHDPYMVTDKRYLYDKVVAAFMYSWASRMLVVSDPKKILLYL